MKYEIKKEKDGDEQLPAVNRCRLYVDGVQTEIVRSFGHVQDVILERMVEGDVYQCEDETLSYTEFVTMMNSHSDVDDFYRYGAM